MSGGGSAPQQVSKSAVANLLVDWVIKGELPRELVTQFESTNRLPKNVAQRVREHFEAAAE